MSTRYTIRFCTFKYCVEALRIRAKKVLVACALVKTPALRLLHDGYKGKVYLFV